jgi:hypothetical protein
MHQPFSWTGTPKSNEIRLAFESHTRYNGKLFNGPFRKFQSLPLFVYHATRPTRCRTRIKKYDFCIWTEHHAGTIFDTEIPFFHKSWTKTRRYSFSLPIFTHCSLYYLLHFPNCLPTPFPLLFSPMERPLPTPPLVPEPLLLQASVTDPTDSSDSDSSTSDSLPMELTADHLRQPTPALQHLGFVCGRVYIIHFQYVISH